MKRIKEIAKEIPPYKRIADIGCDHGNLILEAFKNGIDFAQAIDNKQGPLNSAINNLKDYQNQVAFSLSNGLEDLDVSVEVIILAGMGGSLIVDILTKGINKLTDIQRIIIQANRNIDKIREFTMNYDFRIVSEKIIEEGPMFYEIIVLEKGHSLYSPLEIQFGPYLLQEKSQCFKNKWQTILDKYKQKNSDNLQLQIKVIEEVLEANNEN